MGQAKLRGTYEQRSALAEQRAAEERAERDRKETEQAAAAAQAEAERVAAVVRGLRMSPFLSRIPRKRNW